MTLDTAFDLTAYMSAPIELTRPCLRGLARMAIRLARSVQSEDPGTANNLALDALYFRQQARRVA